MGASRVNTPTAVLLEPVPSTGRRGPRSEGLDDLSASHYGIGVIDDAYGAIALTDDPRRALAALHAFYRITDPDGPRDWGIESAQDLSPGWLHMEDRVDGPWHYWHDARQHDVDVPAIRIDL